MLFKSFLSLICIAAICSATAIQIQLLWLIGLTFVLSSGLNDSIDTQKEKHQNEQKQKARIKDAQKKLQKSKWKLF